MRKLIDGTLLGIGFIFGMCIRDMWKAADIWLDEKEEAKQRQRDRRLAQMIAEEQREHD